MSIIDQDPSVGGSSPTQPTEWGGLTATETTTNTGSGEDTPVPPTDTGNTDAAPVPPTDTKHQPETLRRRRFLLIGGAAVAVAAVGVAVLLGKGSDPSTPRAPEQPTVTTSAPADTPDKVTSSPDTNTSQAEFEQSRVSMLQELNVARDFTLSKLAPLSTDTQQDISEKEASREVFNSDLAIWQRAANAQTPQEAASILAQSNFGKLQADSMYIIDKGVWVKGSFGDLNGNPIIGTYPNTSKMWQFIRTVYPWLINDKPLRSDCPEDFHVIQNNPAMSATMMSALSGIDHWSLCSNAAFNDLVDYYKSNMINPGVFPNPNDQASARTFATQSKKNYDKLSTWYTDVVENGMPQQTWNLNNPDYAFN